MLTALHRCRVGWVSVSSGATAGPGMSSQWLNLQLLLMELAPVLLALSSPQPGLPPAALRQPLHQLFPGPSTFPALVCLITSNLCLSLSYQLNIALFRKSKLSPLGVTDANSIFEAESVE